MDEDVYDRIKARLLAQALPAGQLLQMGVLATELKVSVTPVRDALTRLATERLITFIPRKGFFTKIASEAEIRSLYNANKALLCSALGKDARSANPRAEQPVQRPRSVQYGDAQHLARSTSELFLAMVRQSEIRDVADIVGNINDRLHQARLAEFKVIPAAFDELSRMLSLYETGKLEEVKQALRQYHERRLRLTGEICKELHFRPFSGGQ